jgi:hypothetical protein
MPGVAPLAGARILQRLSLQALVRQTHTATIREQSIAIGGHEMCHTAAKPDMAVEPESAVHRVDHSIAAARELPRETVSGGVVGHRPTIASGLLAEELAFDRGWRDRRHGTHENGALDGVGQRVGDFRGPAGGTDGAPGDRDT